MKTNVKMLVVVGLIGLLNAGCEKFQNEYAAEGGFFGSYTGNYVVRNDSGGRIMDVWVLHNVMVQSDQHGSGWLFKDEGGNVIHLGGDVKVVRVNNEIGEYHEYHAEFQTKSYQELYAK